jgi:hypothetical protein
MSRVLGFIALLSMLATSSHADTCAPPPGKTGEPYATLAGVSKREHDLLLSEYMFGHRWSKHADAVSAGFRNGDRVYGQVLRPGGRFSPDRTAAWRAAYAKSERPRFQARLESRLSMKTVDRRVVNWILEACLESGVWSEIRVLNQCRFVFYAGLVSVAAGRVVQPVRFEAHGGRCERWPERPLSAKGGGVQCVRSGRAVSVVLQTDRAGAERGELAALASESLPPEPVQETKLAEPVSEAVRLSRSGDFRLRQLGRGCPTCALYSADIRPPAPEARILWADTVTSSGPGWERCPAGLRCGVNEFTPPDDPRARGCGGSSECRVWRLAEGEGEASDVVQVTYQTPEVVCVNCPEGMDYEQAHGRWKKLKDQAGNRCEPFADGPPQLFASPAK